MINNIQKKKKNYPRCRWVSFIHSRSALIALLFITSILVSSISSSRRIKSAEAKERCRHSRHSSEENEASRRGMKEKARAPDEAKRSGEGRRSFLISFFVISANCDIFKPPSRKRRGKIRGGSALHNLDAACFHGIFETDALPCPQHVPLVVSVVR